MHRDTKLSSARETERQITPTVDNVSYTADTRS